MRMHNFVAFLFFSKCERNLLCFYLIISIAKQSRMGRYKIRNATEQQNL